MAELTQKNFKMSIKTLNEDGTFEAYGSIFGNVDSYGDIVDKGAFTKTLADRGNKVRLLWQHDSTKPIGKFTSLSEDDMGLKCVGSLNLNVQQGKEAYEHLKHGDIEGMSIGFIPLKDYRDAQDTSIKHLSEVKLYEVSLVTFPANEEANVTSVRSAFETLTNDQRIAVLDFINKSLNPLTVNEPPIAEASAEKHSEQQEAGTSSDLEPQSIDNDALHSLVKLSAALAAFNKKD